MTRRRSPALPDHPPGVGQCGLLAVSYPRVVRLRPPGQAVNRSTSDGRPEASAVQLVYTSDDALAGLFHCGDAGRDQPVARSSGGPEELMAQVLQSPDAWDRPPRVRRT